MDEVRQQVSPSINYHIDAEDRVVFVDDDWLRFAQENDAPWLTPGTVIGSSLWAHITDENTRTIYQMLLAEVRERNAMMAFPFRCDGPECRRFMRMHITPLGEGLIAFKSQLLHIEARPPMILLDMRLDRSDEFITVCSWCNRMALPNQEWVEVEAGVIYLQLLDAYRLPQLTHGICSDCHLQWDRKVAEFRAKRSVELA